MFSRLQRSYVGRLAIWRTPKRCKDGLLRVQCPWRSSCVVVFVDDNNDDEPMGDSAFVSESLHAII